MGTKKDPEQGGAPTEGETDKEANGGDGGDDDDAGNYLSRFAFPAEDSKMDQMLWMINIPWLLVFTLTVPDCSKNMCKQAYPLTFIISILWIGFLCLLMVMTAAHIGCIIGISPEIMGVCVLAIGTSVPDANAIGSNVFDILLGLGVPWTIKNFSTGDDMDKGISVNICGILVAVIILLGTLV